MPLQDDVPSYLTGAPRQVVVFACGDPVRGDDSVAFLACNSLPPETLARADVKLIGAMEAEYVRDIPIGVRAVIVDAVVGVSPGELVEMELHEMSGRAEKVVTTSTHQLPLDQVVAIGQLLRDEPVEGRFVGLGVESVEIGAEPTPAVVAAVSVLRDAVASAINELDSA